MDYHSRSMRGHSSYRGSSHRGSRGGGDSFRGSRGAYSPRGRGGYHGKYEHSSMPKHGSSENKYSSSFSRYDDCYRRSDTAFGSRDHRTDLSEIASRKRERSDSYSQGAVSRRDDDDYRGSSRYGGSNSYSESRGYEERAFKKPRTSDFKPEYRARETIHTRSPRGRPGPRGSFARRTRGDSFSARRRGSFTGRNTTTATPSEILAIRRAKLLQNRLKDENSANAEEKKEKTEAKDESKTESTKSDKTETASTSEDSKPSGAKVERTTSYGRPFMKLQCPQCEIKCVTFKEYLAHLNREVHVRSMKTKSDELKTALASMRIAQRDKQKVMDEEDLTSMTTRTHFCVICKLSYSQERTVHQASDLHKKLRDFLMPQCKTCRIAFQTPMQYEHHVCSLDHLRRVHDLEERDKKSTSTTGVLDNFMVLDSVGSGSGDEVEEKTEDKEKSSGHDDKLILGLEFIRDVKGKYCEVCRTFLPRSKNYERVLQRHCRTKEHLHCYLHYGNEALLEKMQADDNGDVKKVDDEQSKDDVKDSEADETLESEKLWDGLSELLDEAQPRSKSEDEDDEEGGRFDRFKSKEKKENGDISTENVIETEEEIAIADANEEA